VAKSADEATEELLALYQQAVRRQLISDVPVGLLLSGGIDSSLLLALMNLYGSAWPTYTVGYGSSFADDELADAAEDRAHAGVPAHRGRDHQIDVRRHAARIVASLEEPIASSSTRADVFVLPAPGVTSRSRWSDRVR